MNSNIPDVQCVGVRMFAELEQARLSGGSGLRQRARSGGPPSFPSARTPELLDVDMGSADGAGLLQALSYCHGDAIAKVALQLKRLFLLRAPWAPGLRFAGGILPAGSPACAMNSREINCVGGVGVSIEDALAACLGEAVERMSQVRRADDITMSATLQHVRGRLRPAVNLRIDQLRTEFDGNPTGHLDWVTARRADTGEMGLVPAAWCLRSQSEQPLRLPDTAMSTGAAAGPTMEAATLRAVLELIERDAVGLWWNGGRRACAPSCDAAAMAEAHRILSALRQGNQERATWILDLTTDLGVPVMAAVSARPDGYGLVCGFAARLWAQDAVRAAILEMCQMEIGLNIAEAKEASQPASSLSDADQRQLSLARQIDARTCPLLHPIGATSRSASGNLSCDTPSLSQLMQHLAALGIDIELVELTRAEFGIPVVVAIAPELQLTPSKLETKRLRQATAATGGGARFTGGLALF